MHSERKNIFKQLGLILWAFATLVLCFLVFFLARHMLSQGQNPMNLLNEEQEEFQQQEFSDEGIATEGPRDIVLYFAPEAGLVLQEEGVEIDTAMTTAENCKIALHRLIAGPQTPSLIPIMPPDTRIRAVYLRDDEELIIDISSEILFSEKVPRSLEMESLMFYGITNSMSLPQLQGQDGKRVSRVRFLFDGLAPQENFPLNFDLTAPLYPDPRWIAEQS
ncbi:MAG: GerMN domain-containing protein [Candidatus Hydrogenedens sp.]|jgi:hypothetical protein|nr:GerMN domain-containing protein [Candidatus Hydrogenedens sp.]